MSEPSPHPRRHTLKPSWLAAALLLALPGCESVKDAASRVSTQIDRILIGEPDEAAQAPEPAPSQGERAAGLYDQGLAAQRAGDQTTAASRFRQAADLGHPAAATHLGLAYSEGRGVPLDQKQAARWLNLGADRGDARAQYLVGAAFYSGNGVDQDQALGVEYLGRAAVQGDADAQFLLAKAFANGRGVTKNPAWAARWYGKAAYQGQPDAMYAYGAIMAAGRGLPKNLEQGFGWVLAAEQAGHTKTGELRFALSRLLDPPERDRAEAWAKAFRPAENRRFADRPTVLYAQFALNRLGYPAGPADGLMGPRTRQGIRDFQGAQGTTVTGELSPALLERLLERSQSG